MCLHGVLSCVCVQGNSVIWCVSVMGEIDCV